MALLDEPYTISPARTGDAVVSKLVLTGWSAGYATWLEDGRAYWDIVSNVMTLWQTEARTGATTRLCSGTVSSGVVTLSALNSSGISGTARVVHTEDSTGDVIVSYANEQDLTDHCHSVSSFLTSSQWAGQTRYEEAFRKGKAEVDVRLPGKLDQARVSKASGEVDLSIIAKPRQLADVHALFTLSVIFERLASITNDLSHFEMCDRYKKRALERFGMLRVDVNTGEDNQLEASTMGGIVRLVRG